MSHPHHAVRREWQKRRAYEQRLWAKLNTKKGSPVHQAVRLNRMVAEDIRDMRANGRNWWASVTGQLDLSVEVFEAQLKDLEFIYLKTDAAIEMAVKSMREHGMKNIPRELVDRYLTPKTSPTGQNQPLGEGSERSEPARQDVVRGEGSVGQVPDEEAPPQQEEQERPRADAQGPRPIGGDAAAGSH